MKEELKKQGDSLKDSPSTSDIIKELEDCQKQRDEYLAGWQRSKADFINHKKEEIERIGDIMKYAEEEMVLKMIPILDNFNLVENNLSKEEKENSNIKGILQIKYQIQELLKNSGVEEINTNEEKFNPNFHEAIETVESEKESGIILEELQKGYLMNGKLIRPSKVKVAK
jgi:molecular chaperone GrpE